MSLVEEAAQRLVKSQAEKRARILAIAPETKFITVMDETIVECAPEHRLAVFAILMETP